MQRSGKNLLLAAALTLAGAGAVYTAPAEARVAVSIYAPMAPPALRIETVPGPRVGYVWAPGYWNYGHRRYNWQRGHWLRERRGRNYASPSWEQNGNRWRYRSGRWDH